MSAAAQPAGVRGKGFWAGVIGLGLFCLVGIPQGMSGVLIFAGMYLLGTAVWHMLRGCSWLTGLGLGGRRQGVGAAVASVMALGAGGAMAPKPAPTPAPLVAQVNSTPSQTPSQTPTPSATPTASTTPSPVVTPSATPTASKPVVTPKATASPSQNKLRVAPVPAPAATRTTQAPPAPLVRRTTKPAAPTTKATHKATSDSNSDSGSSSGSGVGTVHAGSFCSDAGASGLSAKGKPMVCGEAKDGRLRWKRA